MKKVRVVRCPQCGSTNAGAVEDVYEFTRMRCGECGHEELVDTWQIQFDWNSEIEVPDDVDELPRFVAPLDERFALHARTPDDPTVPALRPEARAGDDSEE